MTEPMFRGLVLLGDRKAEVRNFALRRPEKDEVLIRVKAAGICGSDLHYFNESAEELESRYGVVIGHEPAGVVEAVGGEVTRFRPGDRVAVHHSLGCNHCEHCLAGEPVHCSELLGMAQYGSGGDAEFTCMPERYCYHLPEELSFAEGTFLACTGATAYGAIRKLRPSGKDTVVVFGCGPVGLSALLIAQTMGARVFMVDVRPARLAIATDLGADAVIDASREDVPEAVHQLTGGRGSDLALETSGAAAAQRAVVECLAVKGTAVFVGIGKDGPAIDPERIIHKELTLRGSKVLPMPLYYELVHFMLGRGVRFETMVTRRWNLDDGPAAFVELDSGAPGKFLFIMD